MGFFSGSESACNARDLGSVSGLGRSPGEGNGNPLQYLGLENSMDWWAWQATVYWFSKTRTRVSDLTLLFHIYIHTHTHTIYIYIYITMPRTMSLNKNWKIKKKKGNKKRGLKWLLYVNMIKNEQWLNSLLKFVWISLQIIPKDNFILTWLKHYPHIRHTFCDVFCGISLQQYYNTTCIPQLKCQM